MLVHGGFSDHNTNWTYVKPLLEERFTVYAVARRGRGETDATVGHSLRDEAADVAAIVSQVGEPVFLLGHSYGAQCALEAALEPDRVAKLVLYEPVRPGTFSADLVARLEQLAAREDWDALVETFLTDGLQVPPDDVVALRDSPDWAPWIEDAKATLGDLRALVRHTFTPARFRALPMPVLLLVGSESPREVYATDALAGRLFESTIATMDILSVYLGDQLGLYRALADLDSATSAELAATTRTDERYIREWLEQQAVTGIVAVEDVAAAAGARRYRLPAGHQEVLLDPLSLGCAAPMGRFAAGLAGALPALIEVYKHGGGVSWQEFGADAREAQAAFNRPMFLQQLPVEWLPAMPDVHARLQAGPPARIADIGCGAGWSISAIAQAYPDVIVDGFDTDEPPIAMARANAAEAGVADRVRFHARDAGDPALTGRYDLVTAFECVHDLSQPVEVLRTARRLLDEGGTMLIVDERVAETFTAPGDQVERLFYGFSIFCCLPAVPSPLLRPRLCPTLASAPPSLPPAPGPDIRSLYPTRHPIAAPDRYV